jgi:predicted dehydrogenase
VERSERAQPPAPPTGPPLGLCVVGLGVGRRFLAAARAREDVRPVSVCARRDESVLEAQRAFGVPGGSTDYREAIDRPDVDLVIVASPDRLHFQHAAFALRCGKHVLCEKPVTTDVEDARRLVELAERSGRTFAAGHNYRFIPQFAALRELCARGDLGPLYLGEGAYVQDLWAMGDRGPDYWRLRDPQDMLLGAAIHLVDFLSWCLGPVAEVQAYANHVLPFFPAPENYVATLQFAGGAIGQVVVALGSRRRRKFVVTFRLHGEQGGATAASDAPLVEVDASAPEGAPAPPASFPVDPADALATELAHVVRCVRNGARPLAGVRDGARAVAACAAAGRSVRERRPVRPEGVD